MNVNAEDADTLPLPGSPDRPLAVDLAAVDRADADAMNDDSDGDTLPWQPFEMVVRPPDDLVEAEGFDYMQAYNQIMGQVMARAALYRHLARAVAEPADAELEPDVAEPEPDYFGPEPEPEPEPDVAEMEPDAESTLGRSWGPSPRDRWRSRSRSRSSSWD